jgi:beta-lactamase superfamily II metal-dependent hydrolase
MDSMNKINKEESMLNIEMLQADFGDCLLIEYGNPELPFRILIDGGTAGTYATLKQRLLKIPEGKRRIELLVVTHIDADHIGGALALLKNYKELGLEIGDVWFNGYNQLSDILGAKQGEDLIAVLFAKNLPWNKAFGGHAVVILPEKPLPEVQIEGGATLTLLSPYRLQLENLHDKWKEVIEGAGLIPGQPDQKVIEKYKEADDNLGEPKIDHLMNSTFKQDTAVANGSSIAFILEYRGKKILFGADAYSPILLESLERMAPDEKVSLDAFKVPHHGSKGNLNLSLLAKINCSRYLISTSGQRFGHPDMESIARIVGSKKKATLYFNYRSKFTEAWENKDWQKEYEYSTMYCQKHDSSLLIDL